MTLYLCIAKHIACSYLLQLRQVVMPRESFLCMIIYMSYTKVFVFSLYATSMCPSVADSAKLKDQDISRYYYYLGKSVLA